jgi:hypothetical protein
MTLDDESIYISISILTGVFICLETSGDDTNDAFLAKDCYQQCWEGEHITYMILAGIAIILYEPLSVYMRPQW